MEKLLRLESHLIRAESWLLVVMVLTMLLLGSYNVLYRNVLVAWQSSLSTSGPPVVEPPPVQPDPSKATPAAGDKKAGGGGFGGGFGEEEEPEGDEAPAADEADGFGGGFGEEEEEPEGDEKTPAPEPDAKPADSADGFGGGFGDDEEGAEPDGDEAGGGFGGGFGDSESDGDGDGGGFGGGFGDGAPEVDDGTDVAPAIRMPAAPKEPEGGPPPEGSFSANIMSLIDAIKLDWIDTLLRQLVIMVGFLGAMIATQRRKHINIDAASKLLPTKVRGWIAMAMNVLATGMSIALAVAGWKLVAISRAFPKEIIPHFDEWHMQLMFPVGFGLLALHFAFRVIEDLDRNLKGLPPVASGETADLEREKEAARAATEEAA